MNRFCGALHTLLSAFLPRDEIIGSKHTTVMAVMQIDTCSNNDRPERRRHAVGGQENAFGGQKNSEEEKGKGSRCGTVLLRARSESSW